MSSIMNRMSVSLRKKKTAKPEINENSSEALKVASKGPPPNPTASGGESWTINAELAKVKAPKTITPEQKSKFIEISGSDSYDFITTQYHLGIALGIFAEYGDKSKLKESLATVQWIFYTDNALGQSLSKLLTSLIDDKVVKQEGGADSYSVFL